MPDNDKGKKLSKAEMEEFAIRLGGLQREAQSASVPVIIVFEGFDASGKGTLINRLLLSLDPRGVNVHPINPPNDEERFRPFLWRFWIRTPEKGRIAIFDRSWYGRVLVERVDGIVKKKQWQSAFRDICVFERQLVEDGAVMVKFWLHISKAEQKKRFERLKKNPATRWKVTKDDERHHEQYRKYQEAFEKARAETATEQCPWTVIDTHDRRDATVQMYRAVIQAVERRLHGTRDTESTVSVSSSPSESLTWSATDEETPPSLKKIDLSADMPAEEYDSELERYQKILRDLEHEVYVKRIGVIILYQGWDAAGKGGNIRRLVARLDPRGYEVIPVGPPGDEEKRHHYLWRFYMRLPKAGHIAIFDRSWYGRVLVERVEGLCSDSEWRRAYREINEMERHITSSPAVLVKFWLHIDRDEQLRRFKDRENTPHKHWKITGDDYRNREKWDAYYEAVEEMLARTSTRYAPWTVVASNSKRYARIKTLETVCESIAAVV